MPPAMEIIVEVLLPLAAIFLIFAVHLLDLAIAPASIMIVRVRSAATAAEALAPAAIIALAAEAALPASSAAIIALEAAKAMLAPIVAVAGPALIGLSPALRAPTIFAAT